VSAPPSAPARSAASKPVLVVDGLAKRYGAVQALIDVSVQIRSGELVGLVGDNGAGKSTFVKILAGAVQPTAGTIEIDGHLSSGLSPATAQSYGVETVYQDLGLCDNLSVAENVFLGRELTKGWGPLRRVDRRAMHRQARDVLTTLAVNVPRTTARVAELSGGQRQAVALSRCKLWRRGLMLLDEPTAALGVQESARVVTTVRDLVSDGAAVLLVSHDIPMVLDLCTRVLVLRKGELVADRSSDELTEHDLVSLITGVRAASSRQETA
jgi:ABC-type sugar transport system ATPase subunit